MAESTESLLQIRGKMNICFVRNLDGEIIVFQLGMKGWILPKWIKNMLNRGLM